MKMVRCLMKMVTVKNLKKLSVAVCALGIFAGAVVLPVKAMAAETKAPAVITLPAPFTKDGLTVMRRHQPAGVRKTCASDYQGNL